MSPAPIDSGDSQQWLQWLRDGRYAASTLENRRFREALVLRWAAEHAPLPWDSHTTRLFLFAHRAKWTPKNAADMARAVAGVHLSRSVADPVDGAVKALLARWKVLGCSAGEVMPVDALSAEEVARIVDMHAVAPLPAAVLRRRAWLVAAWWTGLPLSPVNYPQIQEAAAAAVAQLDASPLEVHLPGRLDALRWAEHPDALGCLQDARGLDMRDVTWPEVEQAAFARASHLLGLGHVTGDGFLSRLAEDERYWLLTAIDGNVYRRRRNVAYLLLGVGLALRHETLRQIDIGDCRPLGPDGYDVALRSVKNIPDGLVLPVPHLADDEAGGCGPTCAACALDALLGTITRLQAGRGGPLFATRYGGEWRRWTRQGGRFQLKGSAAAAGLELPRVATRTLRTTGATLAHLAGMSIVEIAATVTHHVGIDECVKYVRSIRPDSDQLFLDL